MSLSPYNGRQPHGDRRTRRCTGAAGDIGFEINVDHGRPVIVVVSHKME